MSAVTRRSFLTRAGAAAAALPALCGSREALAGEGTEAPEGAGPVIFHVILHSPGRAWKPGVGFREQPGVMAHVEYMAGLLETGTLAFGGPYLDDSGGMALLRVDDLDEAKAVAAADPSVQAGLLDWKVVPWLVAMAGEHP